MKKSFVNLLLILGLSISTICKADTVQILKTNISKAEERISKALEDVKTSLNKVKSANKWEAKNWTEAQETMQNFKTVSDYEYSTIDFNMQQLLKIKPSTYIDIQDKMPDFRYLLMELEMANKDLRKRYDKINIIKSDMTEGTEQVKNEMKNRTNKQAETMFRDYIGTAGSKDGKDFVENIATEVMDKVLKGPSMVYSGIKTTFGLYYYSSEMIEQVKSIKNYQDQTQWFNNFQAKVSTDINLSDQGIQMIEKWQRDTDEIKDTIIKMKAKTKDYIERGREWEQNKQEIKFEKNIESSSKRKVISRNFWPLPDKKTLSVSSFLNEAESILKSISAAVDHTMNGDDPDIIWPVVNEKAKELWKKRRKAKEIYDKAKEVYDEARSNYSQEVHRLEELERREIRRLPSGYDASLYSAIINKYVAKRNALISRYIPPAKKFQEADIELKRLGAIANIVGDGAYILFNKLRNYLKSTNAIFEDTYSLKRKMYDYNIYDLKSIYTQIKSTTYTSTIYNLKKSIIERYRFGESLDSIKYSLKDSINSFKYSKKELKSLLPKYRNKLAETQSKANKDKEDLSLLLDKDGILLVSDYSVRNLRFPSTSPMNDTYKESTIINEDKEEKVNAWKKSIDKGFKIKGYDITKAKSFNFNTLISKYEEHISLIENWQNILDSYVYKNETSLYYFNKTMKIHKIKNIDKEPREILIKEMSKESWANLNTNLDLNLKSNYIKSKIKNTQNNLKDMLPREKLLILDSIIYKQAQKVLEHSINRNIYNAKKEDFEALELSWNKLKSVYSEFDKASNSEWSKMNKFTTEKFYNLIEPENIAYNNIPSFLRSKFTVRHNHLMIKYYWLKKYLDLKQTNIRPIITQNSNYSMIDKWISTYKINKEKQDKNNKKAELEAKKRLIELERKQKELERQKQLLREKEIQQEEAKTEEYEHNMQLIQSLYKNFEKNYSNKNLSSLMSLISDDWESTSDGTTLMDLEDTLDNSFSVFDEINCSIENLDIYKLSTNKYQISYVISIKGFIYDNDIEHFEKSSVKEEVTIVNSKAKISKTLNGNFWPNR